MARYLVVARTVTRHAALPPADLPKSRRNVHEVTRLAVGQRHELVVLTVRGRNEWRAVADGLNYLACRGTAAELQTVERLRAARPRRRPKLALSAPWFGRGDSGDGGGTAGVREPRRPKPAPPHLSAVRDLPTATDIPA